VKRQKFAKGSGCNRSQTSSLTNFLLNPLQRNHRSGWETTEVVLADVFDKSVRRLVCLRILHQKHHNKFLL